MVLGAKQGQEVLEFLHGVRKKGKRDRGTKLRDLQPSHYRE